jgi:polyketide synthase PksN
MPGYLCVLSAHTPEQLRRRAEDLLAWCERQPELDLGNMCYSLLLGRSHHNHRLACVLRSVAELIRYLRTWLERSSLLQVYVAEVPAGQQRHRTSLTRYGNQCIEACRQLADAGEYLEQLATVADLYIQGYRLEYDRLFPEGYTRLPLPTYPFARESYWPPGAVLPASPSAPSASAMAAPRPSAPSHSLLQLFGP